MKNLHILNKHFINILINQQRVDQRAPWHHERANPTDEDFIQLSDDPAPRVSWQVVFSEKQLKCGMKSSRIFFLDLKPQ